jgi:hypothetical protein
MIRRDSPRDSQNTLGRDKRRDSQKTQWDKGGIARDRQPRQDGINHPPYKGGYPMPRNEESEQTFGEGVKETAA